MKTSLFKIILVASAVVFLTQLVPAQGRAWEAKRTWVFGVGLLEWKDSESFASFPKENRRDETLIKVLKDRGVPAAQIVYLQDRTATTEKIRSEFLKLLTKTRAGDTVFVYYEGHGYKDDDGNTFFASYDVDLEKNPGWAVASIPSTIEKYFRGSTAIIAMDNCYSGSMIKAVTDARIKVSYAVMASSSASQSSTGNWTFTEALINAFKGSSVTDDNNDGVVTFAELEANASADMLFGEEQVASFAYVGGFDPAMKIADSVITNVPRIGERLEAYSIDGWYKGYVTDQRDGKFNIHYYGYEEAENEWVTPKMMRTLKSKSIYKIGEKVQVEYKKDWYAAHVLNIKGGSHLVSYDDYDIDENEWVSSKRIRKMR